MLIIYGILFIIIENINKKESSVNNIYQLEGRVPVAKAVPFGLQHILAMFVAKEP